MGKLKTHKGVARRFKITANGKLRYAKPGRRHLLAHKKSRRMQKLRKPGEVSSVNEKKLRQLIPYA